MQKKLFDFFAENKFFAYYLFLGYHLELQLLWITGGLNIDRKLSG